MRALLHLDVVTLARVLLGAELSDRVTLCDEIFDIAQAADKYRKRYGICHVRFGSGSLASACHGLAQRNEPFLSDRDYAHCMKVIYDRVLKRG